MIINLLEAVALLVIMVSLTISMIGVLGVSNEFAHSDDGFEVFLSLFTYAFSGAGLIIGIPGTIISSILLWCVIDTYKNADSENYVFYLWVINLTLIILLLYPVTLLGKLYFNILIVTGLLGLINIVVIGSKKKKLKEICEGNGSEEKIEEDETIEKDDTEE